MDDKQKSIFEEGQVLLFDKPVYWTSFDLVNKVRIIIRSTFGIKKIKVGHAGTRELNGSPITSRRRTPARCRHGDRGRSACRDCGVILLHDTTGERSFLSLSRKVPKSYRGSRAAKSLEH